MNASMQAPARWQAVVFGLIALIACVATFVGLSKSDFWIDELFTIYLIKHNGGIAEVVRRQLTDTHPPLYPIFLHCWAQLAGFSEWALRLPSAVFAVLSVGIFAVGTRRVLSTTATAFACAVGTMSDFWFYQSQNARSYALCMALAAGMLSMAIAFRRRVRSRPDFPLAHWIGLSVLGLAASLTHAYLLLALGMILFILILTVPAWRVRGALVATGLVVLVINAVYYRMMLHSSAQDMQNTWFSNSAGFFYQQTHQALTFLIAGQVAVVVSLLLLFGCRKWVIGEPFFVFDDLDTRWTTFLSAFVLVGVIVCGIGVSLAVAPSYSDRNLMTCAPFAWLLIGRLYDAVGPRGYTRNSAIVATLIMLMVGSYLKLLSGRELQRNENWRASSQYVQQLPNCANQPLPVVLPYHFSHTSPYFRTLAQENYFSYYMPPGTQTMAYMPAELAARHPVPGLPELLASRAANVDTGGCTLLAWAVHDLDEGHALKIALDLARQPGVAPHRVLMQEFNTYERPSLKLKLTWQTTPEGYVYLAIPKAPTDASIKSPPAIPNIKLTGKDAHVLGDSVIVDYLTSYQGNVAAPYFVDVYSIERWDGKTVHEDFLAVHRLTCDEPATKANWDIWPDPAYPGCSPLPLPTSAGKIVTGSL
jgi:Dolichyl-phosphate-mannose-protein mannosyltransferase